MEFGFTPVVPPFAGAGQEESVVRAYIALLESLGGRRREMEDYDEPSPLCLLVATGGTESVVLQLHERRQAGVPGEPMLLVAHPGNNSLPASLEVLARLHQDGAAGRIVYLRGPGDAEGMAALERALHDTVVRSWLRRARIGVIGEPSDWLVASRPSADVVRRAWGPGLVPIAIDELRTAMNEAGASAVTDAAGSLAREADGIREPGDKDLEDAARVTVALRTLVDRHELDALTARCFDLVLADGTSGCFALSDQTDAGVIAGCEGDLMSTVGMLWAYRLLGETPWMANPADLDVGGDSLVLAHCTVPRSMVEGYCLRSHFESGLGVGIAGRMPLGDVTLLRIGGAAMDELWLAEGELVSNGDAEDLCRTQVRVQLGAGEVADLLRHPLGNHIVMVYGHHADRLATWWETMR